MRRVVIVVVAVGLLVGSLLAYGVGTVVYDYFAHREYLGGECTQEANGDKPMTAYCQRL
jgi:hypothetical protein